MKMKKKIVAVIQARMGATRLPNKEMLHLHGYPVCEWVYKRVRWARHVEDIVFAIPFSEKDQILGDYLTRLGSKVYAGSETDVLGRTLEAAESLDAGYVIRVCADNPFIDGHEIDNLVEFFLATSCDYAFNHIPRGNKYPDGLGAEMISFDLLKMISEKSVLASQREHSMNYIWDNQELFTISTFDPPDPRLWHPELRLDLDSYSDYHRYLMMNLSVDISSIDLIRLFQMENNE